MVWDLLFWNSHEEPYVLHWMALASWSLLQSEAHYLSHKLKHLALNILSQTWFLCTITNARPLTYNAHYSELSDKIQVITCPSWLYFNWHKSCKATHGHQVNKKGLPMNVGFEEIVNEKKPVIPIPGVGRDWLPLEHKFPQGGGGSVWGSWPKIHYEHLEDVFLHNL